MNSKSGNTFQLSLITVIFFMWGFLTSLNDILIPHLKTLFSLSYLQSSLVQFAFFGAYFLISIPAGIVMSRIGFKNTITVGLLIAAVGAALFFPAAQFASYAFFLGALFVLAAGITFLQAAANPYVTLLGDTRTSSSRLNLVQAFNSLGTTIAPKLGGMLILSAAAVIGTQELMQLPEAQQIAYRAEQANAVKMPYLVIAGVLVALSAAVYFMLRDLKSSDSTSKTSNETSHTFMDALRERAVWMGAIALFIYVGAEVSIGSFLINFLSQPDTNALTEAEAASYVSYYWGAALIGRFAGAALLRKFDAGKMLGIFGALAVALVATTILAHGPLTGYTLIAVGFFNSIMFPTIFALSIRGLGPLTEKASSVLVMAICGGAIIPLAFGSMADSFGLRHAFVIPLICYVLIAIYGFMNAEQEANVHAMKQAHI